MCTSITYQTNDFYFGRTLDYDMSYGQEAVITPRGFAFSLRHSPSFKTKYSIIGIAHTENQYPLYFDAANEAGLCMAALNFMGNAVYKNTRPNKFNIAQFEFIPYILGLCQNLQEAKKILENINLTDTPFSNTLPLADLHWIIADKGGCLTVESVESGFKIYDNPVGVLTNNPTFDIQLFSLNYLLNLTPCDPKNFLSDKININIYSRGLGAVGLPGDLSSQSRFIRAAFTKLNSVCGGEESESVSQFFHILETVSQTKGCCKTENKREEFTLYTSCYNANKGILYYTTYQNRQITAINIKNENLSEKHLISYPLLDTQQINMQN